MRYKQAYYESLHIQTILIAKITVSMSVAPVAAVNETPQTPAYFSSQFSCCANVVFGIFIMKPYSSFIYSCLKPEKFRGGHWVMQGISKDIVRLYIVSDWGSEKQCQIY